MARMIDDDGRDFDIGDQVSFLSDGERLYGRVVRVYSTRYNFHVEVDGRRYEVSLDDDIRLER